MRLAKAIWPPYMVNPSISGGLLCEEMIEEEPMDQTEQAVAVEWHRNGGGDGCSHSASSRWKKADFCCVKNIKTISGYIFGLPI